MGLHTFSTFSPCDPVLGEVPRADPLQPRHFDDSFDTVYPDHQVIHCERIFPVWFLGGCVAECQR